jgi:hypothetical protein
MLITLVVYLRIRAGKQRDAKLAAAKDARAASAAQSVPRETNVR